MKQENHKKEHTDELKIKLAGELGRAVSPKEEINMMTDALLLARYCLKKIEVLEGEIKKLKP